MLATDPTDIEVEESSPLKVVQARLAKITAAQHAV